MRTPRRGALIRFVGSCFLVSRALVLFFFSLCSRSRKRSTSARCVPAPAPACLFPALLFSHRGFSLVRFSCLPLAIRHDRSRLSASLAFFWLYCSLRSSCQNPCSGMYICKVFVLVCIYIVFALVCIESVCPGMCIYSVCSGMH